MITSKGTNNVWTENCNSQTESVPEWGRGGEGRGVFAGHDTAVPLTKPHDHCMTKPKYKMAFRAFFDRAAIQGKSC